MGDRHAETIGAVARRLLGKDEVRVTLRPLRGGLEAAAVHRAAARHRDGDGKERTQTFVVKELAGAAGREAAIYERLVAPSAGDLAPRLFGVERTEGSALLFLEAVRPASAWPWRDPRALRAVLERLARLHAAPAPPGLLSDWNYEAELRWSAEATLALLEARRAAPELAPLGRFLPALRRVTRALPALRRTLLEEGPLPAGPIHGDVHTGNVLARKRRGGWDPVLLDWGRARLGSPLEDVSSWLQSLRRLEPEAMRRHDELLSRYLEARGAPPLGPELRQSYWLAGASNALAGALRYHVSVATDESLPWPRRADALASARDWLRVVLRADACSS